MVGHKSLLNAYTHRPWVSLVRECVNMVSGTFTVEITNRLDTMVQPPRTIFPRVRHFSITQYGILVQESLLQDLYFPSLTAISLNTSLFCTVPELQEILKFTPSLKELHVGPSNELNGILFAFVVGDLELFNGRPLRELAPELEFIHFPSHEHPTTIYRQPEVFKEVLRGSWLQIGAPGNRIKRIELCAEFCNSINQEDLEGPVEVLKPELNGEVFRLSLRPKGAPLVFETWWRKYSYFTDNFNDTRLAL